MTDVTALTVVAVSGSVLILVQLLAVLVCWRFTSIRPRFRAVLQVRDEAITGWEETDRQGRHVWDSHCDDAVLLTHEADPDLSEDNEAYADDFLAWTAEIRERAQ